MSSELHATLTGARIAELEEALVIALGYWVMTFDGWEHRGEAQYKACLEVLRSSSNGVRLWDEAVVKARK